MQSNGLNSLKNFSGEQNLPGYTDSLIRQNTMAASLPAETAL
ncbi:IncF plasmid conjugative transfer protein TraN [Klebsiella pneumoniae IS46]|nr:IncF plasmid conjugative transfer protein TraN [Klebsiella pneumoniae IS46]